MIEIALPYFAAGLLTLISAVRRNDIDSTWDGLCTVLLWPLYWGVQGWAALQMRFNAREFLRPELEPGVAYKYTGTVKWFNPEKGYGFITMTRADGKDQDVFVHYSAIKVDGYKYLEAGQRVEFFLSQSTHGPTATNVRVVVV